MLVKTPEYINITDSSILSVEYSADGPFVTMNDDAVLSRFVSCYKAGNPSEGEDQTIRGVKTFTNDILPYSNDVSLGSESKSFSKLFSTEGTFDTLLPKTHLSNTDSIPVGSDIGNISNYFRYAYIYYTYTDTLMASSILPNLATYLVKDDKIGRIDFPFTNIYAKRFNATGIDDLLCGFYGNLYGNLHGLIPHKDTVDDVEGGGYSDPPVGSIMLLVLRVTDTIIEPIWPSPEPGFSIPAGLEISLRDPDLPDKDLHGAYSHTLLHNQTEYSFTISWENITKSGFGWNEDPSLTITNLTPVTPNITEGSNWYPNPRVPDEKFRVLFSSGVPKKPWTQGGYVLVPVFVIRIQ